MTMDSEPVAELRTLMIEPPGERFWDELHDQLLAAARDQHVAASPGTHGGPARSSGAAPLVASSSRHRRRSGRAALALVAAIAVAAVGTVALLNTQRGSQISPPQAPHPSDDARPVPSGRSTPPTDPTSPTTSTIALEDAALLADLTRPLAEGTSGEDVRMVQQRLADLAFLPGPVDGAFGPYTTQAVWAFETMVMGVRYLDVTGVVTPEMWARMRQPVLIAPRRPDGPGTHVEIYLPQQALVVFRDDRPILAAHISSGQLAGDGSDFTDGQQWCGEVTIDPGESNNEDGATPITDGRCGASLTPGGAYAFYRKVDGIVRTNLGGMYKPVFFNYGIAVHGARNVPDMPASLGAVRVNYVVADLFFDLIVDATGTEAMPQGDPVYVFDGVRDPEDYGAPAPIFPWPWSEWRAAHGAPSPG